MKIELTNNSDTKSLTGANVVADLLQKQAVRKKRNVPSEGLKSD